MGCICAWCDRTIETLAGQPSQQPATNFGMCEDCLRTQLDLLLVPLAKRDLKRAQRMHRSGHSLVDIGRVLGVSQPVVEAALGAA